MSPPYFGVARLDAGTLTPESRVSSLFCTLLISKGRTLFSLFTCVGRWGAISAPPVVSSIYFPLLPLQQFQLSHNLHFPSSSHKTIRHINLATMASDSSDDDMPLARSNGHGEWLLFAQDWMEIPTTAHFFEAPRVPLLSRPFSRIICIPLRHRLLTKFGF